MSILSRPERHDYGLFTIHSTRYSTIDKIEIGGIIIEPSSYALSWSGLWASVVLVFLALDILSYRGSWDQDRPKHNLLSIIVLMIAYILFSHILEGLLEDWSSSMIRYDVNLAYTHDHHLDSNTLIVFLLLFPAVASYYLPTLLQHFNYPSRPGHSRICTSCILWTTVCCHLGFLTNYKTRNEYKEAFIWCGFKLEYRQVSVGLVPLMSFFGNTHGLCGYVLGYIIASLV